MKSYTKSIGSATKRGANQKRILKIIRDESLSFTELQRASGLEHIQVVVSVRQLLHADVLEYVWSDDGRAVYRLKGKEHGTKF